MRGGAQTDPPSTLFWSLSGLATPDHLQHRLTDFRDLLLTVDLVEDAPCPVVIDDRRRLLEIHVQSMLSGLYRVVLALVKLAATDVTFARDGRGAEDLMVGRLTVAAQPAARKAAQELVVLDRQIDRLVDAQALIRERSVNRFRLRHVASKPIQDYAFCRVRFAKTVDHHADRDFVRD